ncbi:two-component system response regulator KdpE [Aquirhabdus parva]|uniref:Two-component system response regulator KdpE n=1 Tax=Aquirhabdus parva TaxID=2283318 RepID=A0A345P465_9GAMM|nr:two-component system response regulator KdpE [Aquirhabdus parva]AXI02074.1 two-component system response regulator KdpE [Aquirhabdus parva]
MDAPNILVIEDEPQIRRFVRTALQAEGWQVFEAEHGQRGLIEAATRAPDLAIVDLGLPDMSGIHVIQDLRTWSAMPIIVLSARSDEKDKIEALDAGADDYLTKPFSVGELLARVRAHLRRRETGNGATSQFIFGDVVVDLARRTVEREGQQVHLTSTEYRLLSVLIRHAGRILTHTQLLKEVWGPNHSEHSHYVRIYMANLRQKLEKDPTQPEYLLTEIGMGYRLMV